jgi:SRSO17 transposase
MLSWPLVELAQEALMTALEHWVFELDALMNRIGCRFARSEARARAKDYLKGLLSPAERKNGWQLAEVIGDTTPYGVQQFLYRSPFAPDALRDDLRSYVVEHLGHDDAILVVDETGFLKKGVHSTGVARQYSGTAGRIENCQIGVFLTYASPHGYAFIDRWLYLPESWISDRHRCQQAGIPDSEPFATKPEMALTMLKRAAAAEVPFGWVTGDSVYGDDRSIRLWLETLPRGYVMAVSSKEYVTMNWRQVRISRILEHLPSEGWERLSAGDGAKGPRLYDWLLIPTMPPLVDGWQRWLLVRRSSSDPTKVTAYACCAPAETPLRKLVQVAGSRWKVETCIEDAKGEVGLDQYEVRSWTGWYKHITLACLAQALLTVMRMSAPASVLETQKGGRPKERQLSSLAQFKVRQGLSSR